MSIHAARNTSAESDGRDAGQRLRIGGLGLAALALAACASSDVEEPPRGSATLEPAPAASVGVQRLDEETQKQVYFGDLHVHSSWSLDAFAFQVRVGPEDAYRYARGGAIPHVSGEAIQMQGPPLDFMALTEHGNYMGIPSAAQQLGHPVRELPLIRALLDPDPEVMQPAMERVFEHLSSDRPIEELDPDAVKDTAWGRLVELANRHDVPGQFTAFVGYEYTSMPEGQNLHRNVIFRGDRVPRRPFSSFESQNPEDLWAWMDAARASGSDVIAIPHNANGSNGLMYERVDRSGRPIDADYARKRMRNEPVSEVIQIKGQSETHPSLSPNDEWARFQVLDTILGRPRDKSRLQGSYARRALADGLELEDAEGLNPYRIGMIGASDSHNASSPVEEDNFTGKIGLLDGTPEARLQIPGSSTLALDAGDRSSGSPFSAAGLAGVWAAANTREHIFDALRAREVFATSGPRIAVRLFGGWDLRADDLGSAHAGYARGVPMGSGLAPQPADGAGAPRFLIEAAQDPREAPLERVQIVKLWVENGEAQERIYDVACAGGGAPDPDRQRCDLEVAAPDESDCRYDASQGQPMLAAAWSDPDFVAGQRGLYYARVLQIPTCRWSRYDAMRLGVEHPPGAPRWIQERAITSPIWYAPGPTPGA